MVGEHLIAPVIGVATAAMGIIAQVPAAEMGGDLTKYGVLGVLAFVIVMLLCFGLPLLLKAHKENFDRLADEVKGLTGEVKDGNDKVATLLQSTLVQILQERHK